MRGVLSCAFVLKQPLPEAVELPRALLARKQYTVTVEQPWATECQAERALRPGLNPAENSSWVELFDLVLPAESDVSRDKGCLNWIQARPQGIQA